MELFRTSGVLDMKKVQETKIMIVGLGSLGSLALSNLVYPWREIVLVEPETLSVENVERHLLGRSQVGRYKVEGVKDYLVDKGIDPATITLHTCFVEDILAQHTDTDIVVVAIDRPKSKLRINSWCVDNDIPAIYGGVYEKGIGGNTYVITRPREVCFQCAGLMMGSLDAKEHVMKKVDYGLSAADLLTEDGVPKAVPALHAPIASIAVDMAMMVMDIVAGVELDPQVLISMNTWEPVVLITPSFLPIVSAIILNQIAMGLVPMWKLSRVNGKYALTINKSKLSLVAIKHIVCPNHQVESLNLEDI